MFFNYIDERCLALYLQEATHLRENTLQSFHQRRTSDKLITTFFSPLSPPKGLKRPSTTSHSRSVRHCTGLYRQHQSYRGSSRHPKTMDCPRMYLFITNFFVTLKDPQSLPCLSFFLLFCFIFCHRLVSLLGWLFCLYAQSHKPFWFFVDINNFILSYVLDICLLISVDIYA